MSDNPWKRQMMGASTNPPPPPPPAPVTSISDNPWKKATQNQVFPESKPPATTPPPPPPAQQASNPWKQKLQQANTTSTPTAPSWSKPATITQPSPTTQASNPWKKNTPSTTTQPAKFQSFKQRKEREERQKLQKEQKEREEKQRIQREERERKQQEERERIEREERQERERKEAERQRLIKEKEETDEARQRKRMGVEDEISRVRQQADKQEQQARKKKPNKKQAIKNVVSPKQHQPSGKKLKSSSPTKAAFLFDNPLASEYIQIYQKISQNYQSYRERLDQHSTLIRIYNDFKQKATNKFKSFIQQSLQSIHRSPKLTQDGITYQISFSTSKIVNGTTIYDESQLKILKRKMRLYELLQNCMLSVSRRMGVFKLRVPMVVLLEYRGVMCLSMSMHDGEMVTTGLGRQISSELDLLQKQVKKTCPKFNQSLLQYKQSGDTYVLYLKASTGVTKVMESRPSIKVNHFQSVEWLAEKKPYSTSSRCLQRLRGEKTGVKQLVQCTLLAKSINKVYRSCHGEVQQSNLWSLVLEKDQQLRTMMNPKIQLHRLGVLFKLFEVYSGVIFEYDESVFDTAKLIVREIKVKQYGYDFSKLQLVQIANNFDRYLLQGKLELAAESSLLRTEINELDKVGLVLNHANLLIAQGKYEQSIDELMRIIQQLQPLRPQRIQLLILLVKNYSLLGQQIELLQNFDHLFKQINFAMGTESPLHPLLYSVMGYFYSGIPQQLSQCINFYQLALGVIIKLYGANSTQAGDLYLDLSQAYMKVNKLQQASYNSDQATSIFRQLNNKLKLAQAMVISARILYLKNNSKEANEKLQQAMKIFMKFEKMNELYEIYKLRLQMEREKVMRNKIIDLIFNLGLDYKNKVMIKKAFQIVLKEEIVNLPKARRQKLQQMCQSEEQFSVHIVSGGQLQQHRKNFSTLRQLIQWALSLLDPSNGPNAQQKGQALLGQIVSYFTKEELQKMNL